MIATVLGVVLIASGALSAERLYKITDEWTQVPVCTSTFSWCNGQSKALLKSESGDPIRYYCKYFRTGGDCKDINITLSDGVTKQTECGQDEWFQPYSFQYVSKKPEVTLDINGPAYMFCYAKSITAASKNVTEITLSPEDGTRKIVAPDGPDGGYDKEWRIKAAEGSWIQLECDAKLRGRARGQCSPDILTIEADNDVKKMCGKKKITELATEVTIRLEVFSWWSSDSKLTCEVKAISS